eukprot:GILJ01016190.1.p1 GENE.GILJ01016190.1~~GILJ01016190.1.p1  ORF type:complete len:606 (-),score=37.54 GILJ01016190.1:1705-3309(-)
MKISKLWKAQSIQHLQSIPRYRELCGWLFLYTHAGDSLVNWFLRNNNKCDEMTIQKMVVHLRTMIKRIPLHDPEIRELVFSLLLTDVDTVDVLNPNIQHLCATLGNMIYRALIFMFQNALPTDDEFFVFRGMEVDLRNVSRKIGPNHYQIDGFLSTSYSVKVAKGFMGFLNGYLYRIVVPAGSRCLPLERTSEVKNEKEILFAHGVVFECVDEPRALFDNSEETVGTFQTIRIVDDGVSFMKRGGGDTDDQQQLQDEGMDLEPAYDRTKWDVLRDVIENGSWQELENHLTHGTIFLEQSTSAITKFALSMRPKKPMFALVLLKCPTVDRIAWLLEVLKSPAVPAQVDIWQQVLDDGKIPDFTITTRDFEGLVRTVWKSRRMWAWSINPARIYFLEQFSNKIHCPHIMVHYPFMLSLIIPWFVRYIEKYPNPTILSCLKWFPPESAHFHRLVDILNTRMTKYYIPRLDEPIDKELLQHMVDGDVFELLDMYLITIPRHLLNSVDLSRRPDGRVARLIQSYLKKTRSVDSQRRMNI